MPGKVLINGVDKTDYVLRTGGPKFKSLLNESPTASVSFKGYCPAQFDKIAMYDQDDSTVVFGGLVLTRGPYAGFEDPAPDALCPCQCGGYQWLLGYAYVSLSYTSDTTLKQVLTDFVAALPVAWGITLDAGQVDGPTFTAPFSWSNSRSADLLRDLTDMTTGAYLISMSVTGVLKMYVAATDVAPYSFTDAAPNSLGTQWTDSTIFPVNTVIIWAGPTGPFSADQTWTGDGSTTSWVTDIPTVTGYTPPYAVVGGVFKTVGTGAQYEWDQATNTLSVGTDSTPGSGVLIELTAARGNPTTAQGPFKVVATSGASPEIQTVFSYPDIVIFSQAQTTANGVLGYLNQSLRIITTKTMLPGFLPGQQLSIDLTNRVVDATCLITEVDGQCSSEGIWTYTVIAIDSLVYNGSYISQWRGLTSGSGGTTVTGAGGGGGTVTPYQWYYLGGSSGSSLAADTQQTIPNSVPFTATRSFTGVLRCVLHARESGVGVTAYLVDETTSTTVATTTKVVETVPTVPAAVTCAIVAGHVYHMEFKNDTSGADVYADSGSLEG